MFYLTVAIEVVLFIFVFWINGKDPFSPSCIMTIMFTISTILALIFKDAWRIDFQTETMIVIISGLLIAIAVDTSFCNINKRKILACAEEYSQAIRTDYLLLSVITVLGIISVVVFYKDVVNVVSGYGYDRTNLFESYRLIKNGRLESLTGKTPTTGLLTNQLFRFTWSAAYVSAFCVANNLNSDKKTTQIGFHLTIMSAASCLGIIEGARGGILQLLAAFVMDYFICLKRRTDGNVKVRKQFLILIATGIIIGIPLFYFSTNITGGSSSKSMFEYIAFYVGGSIALLNMYIIQPIVSGVTTSGGETFIGINNSLAELGVPVEVKQVSLEFRQLQNDFNGNVYTFFRRPLHDFGFYGMLLCVALTMCFFAWIYHRKIKNNDSKFNDYWIILYSLFFYWIVISSIENYLFSISIGFVINVLVTMILGVLVKNYSTQKVLNSLRIVVRKDKD